MAGTPTPLTDMAEGTVLAGGDWTYLVDVSDTTDGTAGSSKKVQAKYWAQTNGSPATITNGGTIALGGYTATVPGTGTLVTTAGTATLSNKSFSDDVGVGTATPDGNARIHVYKDANQSAGIRIQNPNTGNATDSSILFVTDGGTAQAAYIAKTGTAHASEPNLLAMVNREGDISLRTDSGTVSLTDAGAWTVSNANGTVSMGTAGYLTAVGGSFPAAAFRVAGASGSFMHYAFAIPNGTAITLIPNGTGDVAYSLHCWGVIRASDGGKAQVDTFLDNDGVGGSDLIYSTSVTLAIAADGSVTIQRTSGALTYTCSLFLVWA